SSIILGRRCKMPVKASAGLRRKREVQGFAEASVSRLSNAGIETKASIGRSQSAKTESEMRLSRRGKKTMDVGIAVKRPRRKRVESRAVQEDHTELLVVADE